MRELEEDNMHSFKLKLRDKLVDKICPIGERARKLMDEDEDRVLEIIEQGRIEASAEAEKNMKEVKEGLGVMRSF